MRLYLRPSKGYLCPSMNGGQTTRNNRSTLTAAALAVAYAAIPLGTALVRLLGEGIPSSPFLPWAALAAFGTAYAMLFRRSKVPVKKRFIFEVCLFAFLISVLILYRGGILRKTAVYLPYVAESLPLIIPAFCAMWVWTFGLPDRGDFQRYGGLLGLVCVVDLGLEAWVYHAIPSYRWIGDSDILAAMLLVALSAGLKPGGNRGGLYEPDQGNAVWRFLILLGIASCLSPSGLFAGAWVYLCFGRGSAWRRSLIAVCFFLLIGVVVFLPVAASNADRYLNYWLWAKSLTLFIKEPSLLLTGLPLNQALPIEIPLDIAHIWQAVTDRLAILGIYLTDIPSFWLRMTLGWGCIIPTLATIVLLSLVLARISRMGAGLFAVLFAQGMATPLLYDPTLGVTFCLGFALALSQPPTIYTKPVGEIATAPPKDMGIRLL